MGRAEDGRALTDAVVVVKATVLSFYKAFAVRSNRHLQSKVHNFQACEYLPFLPKRRDRHLPELPRLQATSALLAIHQSGLRSQSDERRRITNESL